MHIRAALADRLGALLDRDPAQIAADRPLRALGVDGRALGHVVADVCERAVVLPAGAADLDLEGLARWLAARPDDPGPADGVEPIAVVGMACRFPGAPDPTAYWELLREGRCAVGEVPAGRWDAQRLYHADPRHPGTAHSRRGYFLPEVDRFEPGFFGISPREAQAMDPQQRLMLELSWEALEDAGQAIDALRGSRTGVFSGLIWSDYTTLTHRLGFAAIGQHTVTGSHYSLLSNRVSHVFGLAGPSLSLDVACSSGLVAVHLACQSLRSGESTLALAGGVNLMLAPDSYLVVAKMGTLAPDGLCKAFDARADGFGRGEGGGVLALKTLSRALAAGDRVHCVIRGSATNHNGPGERLTQPNVRAQRSALLAAYRQARVRPADVVYVEAHGAGTRAGDPVEAQALGSVLGPGRPADRPLLIGSAKTNLGHLEGASGLAGLMKAALALRHRTIPPSLHFTAANPQIAFEELHMRVADRLVELPAGAAPLTVGVNAFGLGGSNCHVVVQEHPQAPITGDEDDDHMIAVSAHHPESLRVMARELAAHLRARPDVSLRDVAYTRSRRAHLGRRIAVVGRSVEEVAARLHAAADAIDGGPVGRGPGPRAAGRPVVLVFSGQGGQWPGMGAALLAREPVFHAAMRACDEAFAPYLTTSLIDELTGPADPARFARFSVIQPLLCALQISLARLLASQGVVPAAVVGQSMGEVAAAHVAGALSLSDAARIIARRSALAEQLAVRDGGMAIVELDEHEAVQAIAGFADRVSVASINAPRSTVIAGDRDAVAAVCERLTASGVFTRQVQSSVASHCHHVDAVLAPLREQLAGITPRRADVPIYSTVSGRTHDGSELDADYWAANLRQPVRLLAATRAALGDGHELFVEVAPHPLLGAGIEQLARELGRGATVLPTLHRTQPARRSLREALARLYSEGVALDWSAICREPAALLDLPGYRWQRARHWLDGLDAATRGDVGAIVSAPVPAPEPTPAPAIDARAPVDPAAVQAMLRREVAELLLVPAEPGIDATPLVDLGLDSTAALRLRARSEQLLGWTPAITGLLRDASIASLAAQAWAALAERKDAGPSEPPALDDDTDRWIAGLGDESLDLELLALLDEEAAQ